MRGNDEDAPVGLTQPKPAQLASGLPHPSTDVPSST
jgi:hypothetical protein